VMNLGKLFTHVIKQYNLVVAKGQRCSEAGMVTAGTVESNGCLLLVL